MLNTKFISTEDLLLNEIKLLSVIDKLSKYAHFGAGAKGRAKTSLSVVQAELNRREKQ
tara:strand:- start:564 stop:737 length:174 start_codon:yes stop_codon:yes gene_type:complete